MNIFIHMSFNVTGGIKNKFTGPSFSCPEFSFPARSRGFL